MFLEALAEPHPSGVGFYLVPPVGVSYRALRSHTKADPAQLVQILSGFANEYRRYLDWEAPAGREITYRFEWGEGYAQHREFKLKTEVQGSYSALTDGELMEDCPNPRDALIVYYGTRLAKLVRRNKLVVNVKAGQEESNHTTRYPVRAERILDPLELPTMVMDYDGGTARALDLGHTTTESDFEIHVEALAYSREERDSLRQAIVGLWRDTEYFLESLGCLDAELGGLKNDVDQSEPPFFILSFHITGTFTVTQHAGSPGWEMLPLVGWE